MWQVAKLWKCFNDNACLHIGVCTLVQKFELEVLSHPCYSSGLATSDFHLFMQMKNLLAIHHMAMKSCSHV